MNTVKASILKQVENEDTMPGVWDKGMLDTCLMIFVHIRLDFEDVRGGDAYVMNAGCLL